MAGFSIADLGDLQPSEPVDMSKVAPVRTRFPEQGFYTLRVPETLDPAFVFGQTQSGYLAASIDPVIVGPTNEGYEVRYQKLSAKTFPETDRKTGETRTTSQIARFLGACGYKGELPSDPQAVADAVLEQAGKEFRGLLDWRAYNKRTKEEVVGMENFPIGNNGKHLPWIEDPDDQFVDEKTGELRNRRYSARIFIKRYMNR